MDNTVIKVENLSKQYRLGNVGTGTLSHDLNRWWAAIRGKEDPYLKIGQHPLPIGEGRGGADYVWALRDINFEVKQGEVLGIIGKNGAGKSTLLKILSRVTTPTTGEFKVKGRIASLLEVGTGFHPELSGKENIFLNGAILGMSKREIKAKYDEIVDFSGVERYIDTPVKRYSSGMYVRLAFAVAAHLEPEILIIDEVLAVGDAEFQKKCLGKMKDVAGQGRTVLFVSHNMQAVRQLCSRGILLSNGKIISDDTVDKSLYIYLNKSKVIDLSTGSKIVYNENRRSSGHIKFTAFSVHDKKNELRYNFKMGEPIYFTFSFETLAELQGINITIALRAGISREVITTVSRDVVNGIVTAGTRGTFTFELPDANLRPGEYPLYFQISEADSTKRKNEVIDDLTPPLVISINNDMKYQDFNPVTPVGFFSIPYSKIIKTEINK